MKCFMLLFSICVVLNGFANEKYQIDKKSQVNFDTLSSDYANHFKQISQSMLSNRDAYLVNKLLNEITLTDKSSQIETLLYNHFWGEYYLLIEHDKEYSKCYFKKAEEVADSLNYTLYQFIISRYLGVLYDMDFSQSGFYFEKARKYCLQLDSKLHLLNLIIAYLYNGTFDPDKREKIVDDYVMEAEGIIEQMDSIPPFKLIQFYSLKVNYAKDLNSAIEDINRAISIAEKSNNHYVINDILNLKIDVYIRFNATDSIVSDSDLPLYTPSVKYLSQQRIAQAALVNSLKGDYTTANMYFNEVYQPGLEFENTILGNLNDMGYTISLGLKDTVRAFKFLELKYEHLLKVNELKIDSFKLAFNSNSQNFVEQIELIEKGNRLKQRELRMYIIGLFIIFILLLTHYIYYKITTRQKKKYQQLENTFLRNEMIANKNVNNLRLLSLQIKYPIYNIQVIIENLIHHDIYKDPSVKDLLELLHSSQNKLISNLSSLPSTEEENLEILTNRPNKYLGLNFINLLTSQLRILSSPRYILINFKHNFSERSTCLFFDPKIEFILFDLLNFIISYSKSNSVIDIIVSKDRLDNHLLIIFKVDILKDNSNKKLIIPSNTIFTQIDYTLDSDDYIHEIHLKTNGDFTNTLSTFSVVNIKPLNLTEQLIKDKQILVICPNSNISEYWEELSTKVSVSKEEESFLYQQGNLKAFDVVVIYLEHDTEQFSEFLDYYFTQKVETPLLIIDYQNKIPQSNSKYDSYVRVLWLKDLDFNTIIVKLIQLIHLRKDAPFVKETYTSETMLKLKQLIMDNIDNTEYKLKEIANDIHYSERQVQRIVKQHTGMSISKYILELKLKLAFELLIKNPEQRIQEVQNQIGIKSSSYFGRVFKERFGFPPSHLKDK